MKRSLAISFAVLVGFGCSGGDRGKARPSPPRPDPDVVTTTDPEPDRRDVDPTQVPDGAIATLSVGDPAGMLVDLGAYLTAGGFPEVEQNLSGLPMMMGFAFDKPIAVVVINGPHGPLAAIAGSVGNEQALESFATMGGNTLEVAAGVAVVAPAEQQGVIGPHVRWRLGQPVAPELQFEVDAHFFNMALSMAAATMPNSPLAGFGGLSQLAGSVRFSATEATVKVLIGGQPDTGLDKFAASMVPSDFRMAALVSAPGDTMFGAGTMDFRLVTESMRSFLGPMVDLWRSIGEVTDGSSAMALRPGGGMVGAIAIKDTAAAAAAYEQVIRGMAAPVEVLHTTAIGRLKVKKIAKEWFHEIESSLTKDATDDERAAMKRMFGSETMHALVGVVGDQAISASGKNREKLIADLLRQAKKPGAIKNPQALAAVEEARLANESFVMTCDIAGLASMFLPEGSPAKKIPAAPARPHTRIGMSRVDRALGVRLVLPAPQLALFREIAMGMNP